MKSTRRQFLIRTAKAGLAVAAGVLGGKALANRPGPTYEVPVVTIEKKQVGRKAAVCSNYCYRLLKN